MDKPILNFKPFCLSPFPYDFGDYFIYWSELRLQMRDIGLSETDIDIILKEAQLKNAPDNMYKKINDRLGEDQLRWWDEDGGNQSDYFWTIMKKYFDCPFAPL